MALLQQHAAEVTDMVKRGMVAAHEAMMKQGGMASAMTRGSMPHSPSDSAFMTLQERGKVAMGVDQYTSTHHFEAMADGGRIELQRDVDDPAGVAQIRSHLQEIHQAFKSGDFSTPGFVHMQTVPGATVMAAKRALITYAYRDLSRGGELRITTNDKDAVAAIHQVLAFQRTDHRAH